MHLVSRLLVVMALSLVACSLDPSESTTSGAATVPNPDKIIGNKIIGNKLAAAKLAAAQLAARRLANGHLAVNMTTAKDLLSTADGREVFSFIVSCALPLDVTLEATVGADTLEFPGDIGLFPAWLDHPLSREGQGWVSACLFSRVNRNDVAVQISLRGPNRALTTDRNERAQYSVEEGAFYGNLFTRPDQPINWIACRGEGIASGDTGLGERDCAKPDPRHPGFTLCGFFFAGDCGDFSRTHACEEFSEHGEFYQRCHANAFRDHGYGHGEGDDDRGRDGVFSEVITTFVQP